MNCCDINAIKKQKINKLAKKDTAIIIFDEKDIFSLTGQNCNDSILIVCENSAIFVDDRSYSEINKQQQKVVDVKRLNGIETIIEFLQQGAFKKVGIDYSKCSVQKFLQLKKLYKARYFNVSERIEKERAIKYFDDNIHTEIASSVTKQVYFDALKQLKVGVTEAQIAQFIQDEIYKNTSDICAFETIVAFGANTAVPHHVPNETKLQKNTPVLIDMGAKFNGRCTDFTRTVWFGDNVPTEFINDYNLVLKAHENAVQNIKPKVTFAEADGFARKVFEEENKAQYFTHSLGHGVGYDIHEYPFISPKRRGKMQNGMVFTIEPGLYFENKYGIRLENTYCLDKIAKNFFAEDNYLTVVSEDGNISKIKND